MFLNRILSVPSIPQALIAKLGKNEYVALEVLEKICIALDCDIGDIVEVKRNVYS